MDSPTSQSFRESARQGLRDSVELLSSMRFAISLLTVISLASVIGTVVKQGEPGVNYVNQFGPFWAQVFGSLGLYTVYSAWWFLLILAFLVLSTSLCIARNAPKILTDVRQFKENIREQSLQAFHHKAQALRPEPVAEVSARLGQWLGQQGWRAKVQTRPNGTLIAAKRGSANKLGYIAAHSAIVLICLGGLFDGDLMVRAALWLQDKQAYTGSSALTRIPEQHALDTRTPTFRGNLFVPEGQRSSLAVLNLPKGMAWQQLPFDVELRQFKVDYYETGMPKLFSSDIVIHDHETGAQVAKTVKVNEPAVYRGITLYQSSFEDGGSKVTLRPWLMHPAKNPSLDLGEAIEGRIGKAQDLPGLMGDPLTLELTGLRVVNVENLAKPEEPERAKAGSALQDSLNTLQSQLGSGAKPGKDKHLRNVGPSVSYKLRDRAGQAVEFNNYMLPIELDGQLLYLAGVRTNPNDPYRYLRLPADAEGSLDGFSGLHRALSNAPMRRQALESYVRQATPNDKPEMAEQLRATAERTLNLFAGLEAKGSDGAPLGGLGALSNFIESQIPEAERERISEVLLRILNGCLFELYTLSRAAQGLPAPDASASTQQFMTQALFSLSDALLYPAPVMLTLSQFEPVQASVFQVTKAPGKTLVYLGAGLLIVGVFAMLYVRDRRLWVWVAPAAAGPDGSSAGQTQLTMAYATPRRTLDADAEFESLRLAMLGPKAPQAAAESTTPADPSEKTADPQR
jgi:cytochrome c biogenesis protein